MRKRMMYQVVELFKIVLNLEGIIIRVRINNALDKNTMAEVVELKNSYAISISPAVQDERKVVEIIGHEMTHIKQFVYDGLDLDRCAFKGSEYIIENDLDYWFAPWEVEARGMEQALWAYFCEAEL
jgi:hypothetical protein